MVAFIDLRESPSAGCSSCSNSTSSSTVYSHQQLKTLSAPKVDCFVTFFLLYFNNYSRQTPKERVRGIKIAYKLLGYMVRIANESASSQSYINNRFIRSVPVGKRGAKITSEGNELRPLIPGRLAHQPPCSSCVVPSYRFPLF